MPLLLEDVTQQCRLSEVERLYLFMQLLQEGCSITSCQYATSITHISLAELSGPLLGNFIPQSPYNKLAPA